MCKLYVYLNSTSDAVKHVVYPLMPLTRKNIMNSRNTIADSGLSKIQKNPSIETELVRNLTSIVDKDLDITHHYVVCKAKEILKFSTARNLRDYFGADFSTKSKTAIHTEILESLKHNSALFKVLHSGFTIVAESAKENPNRTIMNFESAQLVNGAQSQGVINDLLVQMTEDDDPNSVYHNALIALEVICTSDIELRNDICNARNSQTPVMLQSRLEAKGVFHDLKRSMFEHNPDWEISGRETQQSDIPVAKLIQITRLFLPNELMDEAKVKKAYVGATSCLNNFETWWTDRNGEHKEIYNFMIAFAPLAWEEYKKWNSHSGWAGNRLRDDEKAIGTKLPDGNWTDIKQGVLFPILRALYCFVEWDGKKASFDSSSLNEDGLIKAAIKFFRENADSNPQTMGKDLASYQTLAAYARGLDIRV